MTSNLLLGWLLQADPTVALLALTGITLAVLHMLHRVILGKSGKPAKRVVAILRAVGDIIARRSR